MNKTAILVNGEQVDYSTLPVSAQDTMRRYLESGCPTGSFLQALLSNDLMDTYAKADNENRFLIFD